MAAKQVTVVLLFCAVVSVRAQDSVSQAFTLSQVGTTVWAAISNPTSKAPSGANMGFVVGGDGVVVIDPSIAADAGGNFSTAPAEELLASIRRLTKLPVTHVINTHHHLDHAGANAVFAESEVIAQRNVREWIHSGNLRLLGDRVTARQKAFVESFRAPTIVFEHGINLYLGARELRLQSYPGHTGGDSIVVIPDAKVVFAGDLFWRDVAPNLVDASTASWIETLDTLTKEYAGFTFVPGHGDVGTVQDVAAFRATLRKLVSARSEALLASLGP